MGCIKTKTNPLINPIDPKAPDKIEEGKKPEEVKKLEPEIKKNSNIS
jgi:hypothetical protein